MAGEGRSKRMDVDSAAAFVVLLDNRFSRIRVDNLPRNTRSNKVTIQNSKEACRDIEQVRGRVELARCALPQASRSRLRTPQF